MISSKQDRVGARTVQDLERRINPTRIREDIETKTRLAIESGLKEAEGDIKSYIEASADDIRLKGGALVVESENFTLSEDGTVTATNGTFKGTVTATAGKIGGCEIDENGNLKITHANISGQLSGDKIDATTLTIESKSDDNNYKVDIRQGTITVTSPIFSATDINYKDVVLMRFPLGNDTFTLCARCREETVQGEWGGLVTQYTPEAIVFRKGILNGGEEI